MQRTDWASGDRRLATRAEPSGAKEANFDGGRWEERLRSFRILRSFWQQDCRGLWLAAALSPALATACFSSPAGFQG